MPECNKKCHKDDLKCQSELECKATADLKDQTDEEMVKEDKPLEELLNAQELP